jgi:hypothetical protein
LIGVFPGGFVSGFLSGRPDNPSCVKYVIGGLLCWFPSRERWEQDGHRWEMN